MNCEVGLVLDAQHARINPRRPTFGKPAGSSALAEWARRENQGMKSMGAQPGLGSGHHLAARRPAWSWSWAKRSGGGCNVRWPSGYLHVGDVCDDPLRCHSPMTRYAPPAIWSSDAKKCVLSSCSRCRSRARSFNRVERSKPRKLAWSGASTTGHSYSSLSAWCSDW